MCFHKVYIVLKIKFRALVRFEGNVRGVLNRIPPIKERLSSCTDHHIPLLPITCSNPIG
jgi:hypothetical protein